MNTPEPSEGDEWFNDYASNASFDQGDVDISTEDDRDLGGVANLKEYDHMVDVAVKSNGQMLALYHNIVEGTQQMLHVNG